MELGPSFPWVGHLDKACLYFPHSLYQCHSATLWIPSQINHLLTSTCFRLCFQRKPNVRYALTFALIVYIWLTLDSTPSSSPRCIVSCKGLLFVSSESAQGPTHSSTHLLIEGCKIFSSFCVLRTANGTFLQKRINNFKGFSS